MCVGERFFFFSLVPEAVLASICVSPCGHIAFAMPVGRGEIRR